MDLKSFAEKQQQSQPGAKAMNEADVRRAINYFGGMSNERLMSELTKQLQAKKRAGREDEIYAVLERIKPMLNADQRKRLDDIMTGIQ